MSILLGSILCGEAEASADELAARIDRGVERALRIVKTDNNRGAMKNHQTVKFRVWDYEHLTTHSQYVAYEIGCKAYVLDSHWLIVNSTCIQAQNKLATNPLFHVDGHTLVPLQEGMAWEEGLRISLLWHPKPIYTGPFVKVLATFSPERLVALAHEGYELWINTSRLGLDFIRRRDVLASSILGNLFHLDQNTFQLKGAALDPLFVISPEQNEFMVAYNAGYITYKASLRIRSWQEHKSSTWYNLDKYDLEFIKKTVLQHRPQDWPRIKQRLFYNQTRTPYFH